MTCVERRFAICGAREGSDAGSVAARGVEGNTGATPARTYRIIYEFANRRGQIWIYGTTGGRPRMDCGVITASGDNNERSRRADNGNHGHRGAGKRAHRLRTNPRSLHRGSEVPLGTQAVRTRSPFLRPRRGRVRHEQGRFSPARWTVRKPGDRSRRAGGRGILLSGISFWSPPVIVKRGNSWQRR